MNILLNEFRKYVLETENNVPKRDSLETQLLELCEIYVDYYNNFNYDFYRNGEAYLLEKLSALPMSTIFDVGSNIGDWSLAAEKFFPASIFHTFEISETPFKELVSKLTKPNFVNNAFGLSDTTGQIQYRDFGDNSQVNSCVTDFAYHPFESTIKTSNVMSGDDYCRLVNVTNIDLLKIDVEGAEPKVLNGFSQMLNQRSIRAIQFEYGYINGDAKFLMRDFYEFFHKYGYIVSKIEHGRFDFSGFNYKKNNFKSGPNYLAIRKDDHQLISLLT